MSGERCDVEIIDTDGFDGLHIRQRIRINGIDVFTPTGSRVEVESEHGRPTVLHLAIHPTSVLFTKETPHEA